MAFLSREALYELVWTHPGKHAAQQFGLSDSGLAKICRKHGIPRPPRGYWAKLAAGKTVERVPLPARGLGMPQRIEITRESRYGGLPNDPEKIEILPVPSFDETLEEIEPHVRKMVGQVRVPATRKDMHGLVRRLLEQDEERRKKLEGDPFSTYLHGPLFDSRFEKRRLRLISAILVSLDRCGAMVSFVGKDPEGVGIRVGDEHLSFTLDHPGISRLGWRHGDERNRPDTLPIQIEIESWPSPDGLQLLWMDDGDRKLETQLSDIVVTLILAGEAQYRAKELLLREQLITRKQELIELARQRAEQQHRQRGEERHRREQARIDRLLLEAEMLQKAETIRTYVALVQSTHRQGNQTLTETEFNAWADWALAEADRIDPVLSGTYVRTAEEIGNDSS